jgi:hypothetical protein
MVMNGKEEAILSKLKEELKVVQKQGLDAKDITLILIGVKDAYVKCREILNFEISEDFLDSINNLYKKYFDEV